MLYKHLTDALDLEVVLEPQMTLCGGSGVIVPDIVVLGAEIAVVAELKFVPHGYPVFEGDIAKFRALVGEETPARCWPIDPFSGRHGGEPLSITPRTRFAFFAVGQSQARAIDAEDVRASAHPAGLRERLSVFYGCVGGSTDGLLFDADLGSC